MPRYKITVEYDGTDFVGWQRQDNGASIQQSLEEAVFGFCQKNAMVYGAGRTDAGVHALRQVAHIDLEKDHLPEKVRDALNAHLRPLPICVLDAELVDSDFHARFSATSRSYIYRILNRKSPAVLERNRVWWVPVKLDEKAMNEAAQVLIGKHDFSTFRASECQAKSPVKTLDYINVERNGDEIIIKVHARSFLHHQVRNIAGTLKLVGTGKWSKENVKKALKQKDRKAGGPTAPAEGLYLAEVKYE